MSNTYNVFTEQNFAPDEAKKIGIYKSNGERVAGMTIPNSFRLDKSNLGLKKYSFGCISDLHMCSSSGDGNTVTDLTRAIEYFKENGCAFTCFCGDFSYSGTIPEMQLFKSTIDKIIDDTMPLYAISGNHEGLRADCEEIVEDYTGHPLYYKFEYGDDVFVFVGTVGNRKEVVLNTSELQWLYNTLEENRNKRVFLFQHVRPTDASRNALSIYGNNIWAGTEKTIFESMVKHYKNVIFFHGHSHVKLFYQYTGENANYDSEFGMWSIHVPSISCPRYLGSDGTTILEETGSEGYICDVYQNGIVIRGRDFELGLDLPIAQYQFLTNLSTIEANGYVDTTGRINTSGDSYSIAYNLENVSISNSKICNHSVSDDVALIGANYKYQSIIEIENGLTLESISILMGGSDVTSSYYDSGVIKIPSVIGDLVINATANVPTGDVYYNVTTTLNNSTIDPGDISTVAENTSYSATVTANSGYTISSIYVEMNGEDISSTVVDGNLIRISSVTGNVSIVVTTKKDSSDDSGNVGTDDSGNTVIYLSKLDSSYPDVTLHNGNNNAVFYIKADTLCFVEFIDSDIYVSGNTIYLKSKTSSYTALKYKIVDGVVGSSAYKTYSITNSSFAATDSSITNILYSTVDLYSDSTMETVEFAKNLE